MSDTVAKEKTPFLRQRFNDLQAEKARILAVVAPAREAYERLINDPALIEAKRIIKENNPKLAEIDQELAALSRALGGKVIKAEPGQFNQKVS